MGWFRRRPKLVHTEGECEACIELATRAVNKMRRSEFDRMLRWIETGEGPMPRHIRDMDEAHRLPGEQ